MSRTVTASVTKCLVAVQSSDNMIFIIKKKIPIRVK